MEWQPIETAPKEKIVLLGFFDSDSAGYQDRQNPDCHVQVGKVSAYSDTPYVMCGAPANQHVNIWLDVTATHWMPLPPPPGE